MSVSEPINTSNGDSETVIHHKGGPSQSSVSYASTTLKAEIINISEAYNEYATKVIPFENDCPNESKIWKQANQKKVSRLKAIYITASAICESMGIVITRMHWL